MAITQFPNDRTYYGLSTDDKTPYEESFRNGDIFKEIDTGAEGTYDEDSGTFVPSSSGSIVTIGAGSALIGKVSIDQVTPNANEVVLKTGSITDVTLAAETTKVIGTVNDKVADGDDVALGAKSDPAATIGDATPFSVIAMLKGIWNKLGAVVLTTSSAIIGKVSIDQVTADANKVVTKTGSVTSATLTAETTKVIGTVNNKVADGDDTTLGSKTDAASITGDTTSASAIAMLKGIWNKLGAVVLTTGTSIIGKVSIDQVTANANEVVTKSGSVISGDLSAVAVFHNAATVAANGTDVSVGNYKTLTLEIYGTSTSRTLTFYAKGGSGVVRAMSGVRLSDYSVASSTTTTDEIWQFDVTGTESVIIDLTAVAGGNVTASGRFMG